MKKAMILLLLTLLFGIEPLFSNIRLPSKETPCSEEAVLDLETLYDEVLSYPGGENHIAVFGNGEVLYPGVYDVGGATSLSGTLTIDGEGNPNSIFIIRSLGALSTAASTTVILTGNAKPENIFWISGGAISTGASTIMKGTLLGGGAVSLAASTNLEGRMFTKSGAVSLGASAILSIPTGATTFNLGVLSTFAMWSSVGAISSAALSNITGNVGTTVGAITIAGEHNGAQYPPDEGGCSEPEEENEETEEDEDNDENPEDEQGNDEEPEPEDPVNTEPDPEDDNTLSTPQNEMSDSIKLYPNPSRNGYVYINYNPKFGNGLKVSVFNMAGQNVKVSKYTVSPSELKLNTSSLNSGIYIIKLTYQTQISTHKLIVE